MAMIRLPRKSKYGNKKVTTLTGEKFDSKKEAARYAALQMLEKAGKVKFIQRQVPFPIEVNGHHICKYIADFVYLDCETMDNVIEDAKGVKTDVYKLKKKLVKAVHGKEIREV